MSKKELVFLAIIILALGIILFSLGFVLGKKQAKTIEIPAQVGAYSKVISSINAYGKVLGVQGRNVKLSNLGEEMVLLVPESAKIFIFEKDGSSGQLLQKTADFSQIKIGENLNMVLTLGPDGDFQASSAIILPPGRN